MRFWRLLSVGCFVGLAVSALGTGCSSEAAAVAVGDAGAGGEPQELELGDDGCPTNDWEQDHGIACTTDGLMCRSTKLAPCQDGQAPVGVDLYCIAGHWDLSTEDDLCMPIGGAGGAPDIAIHHAGGAPDFGGAGGLGGAPAQP